MAIYNGFELLEHEPIPGKEEYLDSEKYELKTRDWDKPGNIKDYIGRLNRLRHDNPALLQTSNLQFAQIDDAEVIGFVKESAAGDNAVAVAVALTKAGPRQFWFHFGDIEIGPRGARRRVSAIEKSDHRRTSPRRMGRCASADRPRAGSRTAVSLPRVMDAVS